MKLLAGSVCITLALLLFGAAFATLPGVAQDPLTVPTQPPVEPPPTAEPGGVSTYSGKGVAGALSTAELDAMGADWFHAWRLCQPGMDSRCVNHVKSSYGMIEKGDTIDDVVAALETCQNGWFMFGDEFVLQQWPMDRQIAELFWFSNLRDAINPDCRLVFGGVLITYPVDGEGMLFDWPMEFAAAYQEEYGELPDVDALMVDAYLVWNDSIEDWEQQARRAIALLRMVWGWDVEVWAREIGALSSHGEALRACENLEPVASQFDRSAWFVGRDPHWNYTALYDGGNMTDLGACYRGDVPVRRIVPVIEK